MSIEPASPPVHPVLSATAQMSEALKSVSDVNPTFMRTETKASALCELAAVEAQVAELRLRILADAQDVAMEGAARDAGVWLSHETRAGRAECRADLALATDLDRRRVLVAEGMRAGTVNLAQARVICRAVERLPKDVPAETVIAAEAFLVDKAAEFGPDQLARLGRRILQVVAPEIADAIQARALAAEEADARTKTRITLRRLGDGTTSISGVLPDHVATRLAVYLEAHTNPRKKDLFGEPAAPAGLDAEGISDALDSATANQGPLHDDKDPVERLPHCRRLGEAFCAFLEGIDPKRLPIHGGAATTLIVSIDFDKLKAGLATADILTTAAVGGDPHGESLGGGHTLTAGEVRRLACNADIIPVVLSGKSEILDFGRAKRLYGPAQHRALLLRDRTCRAEGCDIPGTWAEAHHWIPWELGGRTDIKDGVLLCSHHHHRAHDDRYVVERLPNGDVRFSRRS